MLDEQSFLNKNTKLAPKFTGPHKILQLKGDTNAELQLKNGRKTIVHFNRLKPYVFPLSNTELPILSNEKQVPSVDKEIPQSEDNFPRSPLMDHVPFLPPSSQKEVTLPHLDKANDFDNEPDPLVVTRPTCAKTTRKRVVKTPGPPPIHAQTPVEGGGIASRTRSRLANKDVSTPIEETDLQTGNFKEVTDEFEPEITPIKQTRNNHNQRVLKKNKRYHNLTFSGYKKGAPKIYSSVYYTDSEGDNPAADSNSSDEETDKSDKGTEIDDHNGTNPAPSESEAEFFEAQSEVDTTLEDSPDNTVTFTNTGKSPKNKDKSNLSTFDKIIVSADNFLFGRFPKRNLPKKNYKE